MHVKIRRVQTWPWSHLLGNVRVVIVVAALLAALVYMSSTKRPLGGISDAEKALAPDLKGVPKGEALEPTDALTQEQGSKVTPERPSQFFKGRNRGGVTPTLEEAIAEFKASRVEISDRAKSSDDAFIDKLRRLKCVVVTGANMEYYRALTNLVGSIHFWEPARNIVIFDLGIHLPFMETLKKLNHVTVLKIDNPGDLKEYSWKATCIRIATELFGKVVWMDAGSDVRGPMDRIDDILAAEDGLFVQGQDEDMAPWSDEQTLAFFGTTKTQVSGKYSYSGNLQGYVYDSRAFHELLRVVEQCSHIPACIVGASGHLGNHRFDQVALSAAIYTSGDLEITAHTELIAAERHQLERDYTQPSKYLVFTGRGQSSDYIRYMKLDSIPFDAPIVESLKEVVA